MDARRSSVGLYARYATPPEIISFDYARVPLAHTRITVASIHAARATPSGLLPRKAEQRLRNKKKGVSYTTPHNLARKNPSRIEKRQTPSNEIFKRQAA